MPPMRGEVGGRAHPALRKRLGGRGPTTPSPNCPHVLLPHVYTRPVEVRATEKRSPHPTSTTL